jgi:hypothetical protein
MATKKQLEALKKARAAKKKSLASRGYGTKRIQKKKSIASRGYGKQGRAKTVKAGPNTEAGFLKLQQIIKTSKRKAAEKGRSLAARGVTKKISKVSKVANIHRKTISEKTKTITKHKADLRKKERKIKFLEAKNKSLAKDRDILVKAVNNEAKKNRELEKDRKILAKAVNNGARKLRSCDLGYKRRGKRIEAMAKRCKLVKKKKK